MKLDSEDRWKAFYLGLKKIPWTVVFDQRPKMQITPFTWAPSTWISSGKDQWLHYDNELADITETGLRVSLKVLILDQKCTTNAPRIIIEADQDHYELSRTFETTETSLQCFNIIFVRYLKHEEPHTALQRDRPLPFAVGLGVRSIASEAETQHQFNGCWDIRALIGPDEIKCSSTTYIRGSWERVQCCFA